MRLLQAAPHLSINSSTTSRPTFVNFGSGGSAFHLEEKGTLFSLGAAQAELQLLIPERSNLTHLFRAPVPPKAPPFILSPKSPRVS